MEAYTQQVQQAVAAQLAAQLGVAPAQVALKTPYYRVTGAARPPARFCSASFMPSVAASASSACAAAVSWVSLAAGDGAKATLPRWLLCKAGA